MDRPDLLDAFLELSSVLTGFDTQRLIGTGQGALYLSTAIERGGEENIAALLAASHAAPAPASARPCPARGGDERSVFRAAGAQFHQDVVRRLLARNARRLARSLWWRAL